MKKFIYKNGKKTDQWTKEWLAATKQWQKDVVKLKRLYYYDWGNEVGAIKEIPTKEYRMFREKWTKILVDEDEVTIDYAR